MAAPPGSNKVYGVVAALTFVIITLTYLTSRNISSSTVRAINEGYRSVMSPLFAQAAQEETSNISALVREEIQSALQTSLESLETQRDADMKMLKEEIANVKSAVHDEIKDSLDKPLQSKMKDIYNAVKSESKRIESTVETLKITGQTGNSSHYVRELAKKIQDVKIAETKAQEIKWDGFGPEIGQYNFTVVAAMMDIGRGSWPTQKRTYTQYLKNMQQVLKLDVNMVLFVDVIAKPVVDKMRKGRENRTAVTVLDFKSLPYYRHRDRMSAIMSTPEYKKDNELYQRRLCESLYPDYDILQLSKLYFMDRAAREDPFNTTYLMWLDGGYGHGNEVGMPVDGVWKPRNLFEAPDQVTFILLKDKTPGEFLDVKDRLNKMHISIMAGLFFGAGREVFKELYAMQVEEVERWLEEGIVDDDQTMYMMLYFRKPELFRWVRAGWYDVFRAFQHEPPQEQQQSGEEDTKVDEAKDDEEDTVEEAKGDASKDEGSKDETSKGEEPKDVQNQQKQQLWPKEGEVQEIQEQEEVDEDPVEKQV